MQWGVSEGMSHIVASLVHMFERPFNDHSLMFLCIRRATGDVVKFFIGKIFNKKHIRLRPISDPIVHGPSCSLLGRGRMDNCTV